MKKEADNTELLDILRQTRNKLETIYSKSASTELLNLLSDQLDQQITLLRQHLKSEDRISHLESLINASRILNSTLDLEELLRLFMDLATREVKADRSTLYLVDKKKNELWSMITQGPDMVEIRLPVGQGIAGKVAATGEVINIDDPYNDPRFYREIDRKTGYVTRNILCMPVRNKEQKIIGVMQILNKKDGSFNANDEYYLENLAIQASLALENAQLHKEALERRRLEAELRVAYKIQKNLLPTASPELDNIELAGINIPCQEVGGDYFDYLDVGDALGVAIGDVSGKGIPASLIMANLQAALRVLAPTSPETCDIVTKMNILLKQASTPNKFVTFFYGLLNPETKTFTYTNAGHNPPVLVRPGQKEQLLSTEGLIMGAFDDAVYNEKTVQLKENDILVLYTDGITESINDNKEYYGEERLVDLVVQNSGLTPQDMITCIIDNINEFSQNQPYSDDVTLIVIKINPS